jgi:hypothetical protein
MLNCIDEKDFALPHTYIGIDNNPKEGCPNICLEFDVSLKIFILAFILSKLEIACNNETKKA